LLSSAGGQINL